MADSDDKKTGVILPLGRSPDGGLLAAVSRDGVVSTVNFVPVGEGKPIQTPEYAVIRDMPGTPYLSAEFSPNPGIPTVATPAAVESARGGPAKVNSQAYRDGWDRIFGRKAPTGEA